MARSRRLRWIAITAVAAALASGLAVGAEAWADKGVARCSTHAPVAVRSHAPGANDQSWRSGAFKAAGCRAWRRMHRHPGFGKGTHHGTGQPQQPTQRPGTPQPVQPRHLTSQP